MTTTPTDRDLLPCDVWLAPATRFKKGVPFDTLRAGMALEGRPDGDDFVLVRKDYRAEIEAATIARLVEQAGVTGEELAKRVNHDESGAYLADDAAILNQALAAAVAKVAADNARLRETLEWYAEPVLTYAITQASEPRSAVHADGGKRARTALKETNDGE